jgi:recombination protein RecA
MALLRRPSAIEKALQEPEIQEEIISEIKEIEKKMNIHKVVSSGSTLLDLAITGGVNDEGGIPGGMFMEYFGPSGGGKTSLLSELAASVQGKGGMVRFLDPEARLDKEYSQIYGVSMDQDFEYYRPDTVASMFTDYIWPWSPDNPDVINMVASDSIAALSTDLEMDKDEGDKMGMRRAKEFSEGLRKTCRLVAKRQWLIAFSNQIRMGEGGKATTPGGMGVPFYASLRIQVKQSYPSWQIKKKISFKGKELEKVIGVMSTCTVVKSSIDVPYREAPISVVFGYGIDTIRDELQFYKSTTGEKTYNCFDKNFQAMEDACIYIENSGYEKKLKARTIGLWREIQEKFKIDRKIKQR